MKWNQDQKKELTKRVASLLKKYSTKSHFEPISKLRHDIATIAELPESEETDRLQRELIDKLEKFETTFGAI